MNEKPSLEYFKRRGLLPFQVEYAQKFLSSEVGTYSELVLPVGSGKIKTGSFLLFEQVKENINGRFLILAPAILLEQWQYEIEAFLFETDISTKPLIVDRKTYLELETKTPIGQTVWPESIIIIMSIDLAKRADMVSNLMTVVWDLIIYDESHLLKSGKRRKLYDNLREKESAKKGLLLTVIPQFFDNVQTQVIDRNITDWDNRPIFQFPDKKISVIKYYRTKQELLFFKQLEQFSVEIANVLPYGEFHRHKILQTAASSIYAVETALRRLGDICVKLRNMIVHKSPSTEEDLKRILTYIGLTDADDDFLKDKFIGDKFINSEIYISTLNNLNHQLETLLNHLEEGLPDSKLDTLLNYLQSAFKKQKKKHLCIWCSYDNTASYLESSIELPVYRIRGDLTPKSIEFVINNFKNDSGVMVITNEALEGLDLKFVDECVNYDLPVNVESYEQRLGRFSRFGRKKEFRMIILKEESEFYELKNYTLEAI